MIRPYTGSIGAEMDEAIHCAEQAGYTVAAIEEIVLDSQSKFWLLSTKKVLGMQVSEILSPTGFLQTFGRH